MAITTQRRNRWYLKRGICGAVMWALGIGQARVGCEAQNCLTPPLIIAEATHPIHWLPMGTGGLISSGSYIHVCHILSRASITCRYRKARMRPVIAISCLGVYNNIHRDVLGKEFYQLLTPGKVLSRRTLSCLCVDMCTVKNWQPPGIELGATDLSCQCSTT